MQELFSHSRIANHDQAAYCPRMNLSLRIRELRKQQKLTLADLADRVGVSIPHMSEVERGKKNLNNHLMIRIASALKVQPRDLLIGDEELQQLDMLMTDLDTEDRQRVLDFAKALSDSQKVTE